MKRWLTLLMMLGTVAGLGLVAPTVAQAETPYCGIVWGSLPETAGSLSVPPLINVRAGQHECYDRLVLDIGGAASGYDVRYVTAVRDQGAGNVVPLRGGAFLEIVLMNPAYDVYTGQPTYMPANPQELVNVYGWRTFRQVASGGTFEGYTTIGLGVRARLPFRVFTLAGPGGNSRVVIDVAHRWLA